MHNNIIDIFHVHCQSWLLDTVGNGHWVPDLFGFRSTVKVHFFRAHLTCNISWVRVGIVMSLGPTPGTRDIESLFPSFSHPAMIENSRASHPEKSERGPRTWMSQTKVHEHAKLEWATWLLQRVSALWLVTGLVKSGWQLAKPMSMPHFIRCRFFGGPARCHSHPVCFC